MILPRTQVKENQKGWNFKILIWDLFIFYFLEKKRKKDTTFVWTLSASKERSGFGAKQLEAKPPRPEYSQKRNKLPMSCAIKQEEKENSKINCGVRVKLKRKKAGNGKEATS